MISLDFEWQTNEFMLYCRITQLREKSMMAYEQSLKLFERWCRDEMGIFTVDKVTENVQLYWNLVVIIEVVNDFLYLDGMSFIGIFQKIIQKVEQLQPLVL